ncbi:hypothetical protein ACWGJ2_12855 [Streptomyces sp. NPDC054796]
MTTYDMESTMGRAVTITGTRSTGHRPHADYSRLFADYLGPFAHGRTHFYIGGAKGIDSLALLWLAEESSALLTVVVPNTLDQQPDDARRAVARAGERIHDVVELRAEQVGTAAFHARNRWMVDHSDMTIGFPLAAGPRSGTWQTLDYATRKGQPRLIVPV